MRTTLLEVRYLASPLHRPRVGIVVPKFGRSAVDRNTVKRRLRELVRTELLPTLGAFDLVVRATLSAYSASFDELSVALRGAVERIPAGPAPGRRSTDKGTGGEG